MVIETTATMAAIKNSLQNNYIFKLKFGVLRQTTTLSHIKICVRKKYKSVCKKPVYREYVFCVQNVKLNREFLRWGETERERNKKEQKQHR